MDHAGEVFSHLFSVLPLVHFCFFASDCKCPIVPVLNLLFHLLPLSGWNAKCGSWVADPFNDYCYLFTTLSMRKWADARTDCLNQGGDLISITEPFEQGFIQGKYADTVTFGVTFTDLFHSLLTFTQLSSDPGGSHGSLSVDGSSWLHHRGRLDVDRRFSLPLYKLGCRWCWQKRFVLFIQIHVKWRK